MKRILKIIRSHVISKEEEFFIAFGKVYFHTNECFNGFQGSLITETPIFGFDKNECFCLSDIYVDVDGYSFGYIQRIEIHLEDRVAKIGHIATGSNFTRMGLGKKLIYSFSKRVKIDYGVEEIHFCESSQLDVYPYFFKEKLGATHVLDNGCDKWIWKIPDHIS